jgi:hypothetical protein
MRRTSAAALTTLVTALLVAVLAGCGSGGGSGRAPQGNPDARVGAQAVDDYAATELLRAQLIASSDSYAQGAPLSDARQQLVQARQSYAVLAPRVQTGDPVVAREVAVRFNQLQQDLQNGGSPPHYQALAGPLSDQLMDGVLGALLPAKARTDRGVQAESLRRLVDRLAATYDAAASAPDPVTGRLAFEDAWGLWRRAQTLSSTVKPYLGSAGFVPGTINNLRNTAFPNGPRPPRSLPSQKVDIADSRIQAALDKRFSLQD